VDEIWVKVLLYQYQKPGISFIIEKKGRCIEIMKKIPKFKNEDQERDFWKEEDSSEYIDWKKAKKVVLHNLKPSVKTIS
jgi:hypothetical protein